MTWNLADTAHVSGMSDDKAPYTPPQLRFAADLGRVVALDTQVQLSAPVPLDQQDCWIARAVFGERNPIWLVFRAWLLTDAPAWLRGAYRRVGPRLGPWIAERDWARRALRPVLQRAVRTKLRRLAA